MNDIKLQNEDQTDSIFYQICREINNIFDGVVVYVTYGTNVVHTDFN